MGRATEPRGEVGPLRVAVPLGSASTPGEDGVPYWLAGTESTDPPLPVGGCVGVEEGVVLTCRFGVRRYPNGSPASFEGFDRMTGEAVASEMSRAEAEAARRRNHDTSGEPGELCALRAAVDALVAQADQQSLILVARAAETLDDAREELAKTERIIAEHQARMGQLRTRFPGPTPTSNEAAGPEHGP